ncbi:MAG: 1-phosphofructokinase, partial [Lachnospiraceae bacterium]|nr:1-phosphofructokinase [Lachnospiraceae bacterium]
LANFRKEFTYACEQCELMVFSGSIPQGVPVDIYAQLIAECRQLGIKTLLDTSGEPLKEAVLAKPTIIKPNKKELEYLVGRKLPDRESIVKEAKALVAEGIEKVVVSLGEEGLLYMDTDTVIFEPAKKVKAVNTVGCGDSVVASFCMSEVAGEDAVLAMQKAVALSAANATTKGSAEIPLNTYLDLL